MHGFKRAMHHAEQVGPHPVRVDRVLQARRERRHRLVRVVPGPVEPPVHEPLDPGPQRAEQRRRDERGPGHRHR